MRVKVILVLELNGNDNMKNKKIFWEDVQTVTDEVRGQIIVLGDFHGRVGNREDNEKIC